MVHAALGLRAHSGWAVLVAITGPARAPNILDRRRIELIDASAPGSAQPYHAAAEMELSQGEELIGRAIASSRLLATKALRAVIAELRKKGYDTSACGIVTASGKALPPLPSVLASHALIHTAEGEMFREALAYASQRTDLQPLRIPEKELFAAGHARLGIPEDQLKRRLAELGKRIGPPWRQDEKSATVVAALALHATER